MAERPEFGTAPIRCGKSKCKWRGFETDLRKQHTTRWTVNVCPLCGCDSYMFMTPTFEKGNEMDEKEKAVMDAGVQYGMQMLQQMPRGDQLTMEAHMTGVLIAFWGALWGTFGTEYARGFIEAQLRGMEPDVPHEKFTEPRVQ